MTISRIINPALTFYQKSPDSRYISDSNFAGKCDMMLLMLLIYDLMTEDQLTSLERIYPAANAIYLDNGIKMMDLIMILLDHMNGIQDRLAYRKLW